MSCNICMGDDIEDPGELMACGNEGCTFRMCRSCTRSYYGRRYGYRKCPQCRASPLGREVRLFIPPAPEEPSALPRFPPSSPRNHPTLVCVYLAMSILLAWFVGATICQVILRVNYDRMGMAPGLYIVYQIIVGYLWLISLIVVGLVLRSLCNRIWATS
jgi:hypothetical protein